MVPHISKGPVSDIPLGSKTGPHSFNAYALSRS